MKNTFGLADHRLSEVVLGGSRSSKSGTLIEEALSTMAVDLALKQDDEAQSIQALQEQKADLDAMREVKLLGAKDLIRREGICLGLVFRGLRAPACVLQTSAFLQ